MKNIVLLARRELGAYLRSPMGYIIVAIVLFADGLLFNFFAIGGKPKLSAEVLQLFFAFATFMTMVSGILLSMRLFAEERQLNTLTLLLTSPIRDHEIVLGKFLSALVFFIGMTALTIYMPLLIFINGKVSIGHILGGYLGLAMLGMASISVGIFASSVAKNQLIALVLGAGLMVAIYLCYLGASKTEPPIRDLMAFISPQKHLTWQTGLLNSRDIFYYLSMTYFFLLLTIHMIKSRRWR